MRVLEGIHVTRTPRIAAALAELRQLISNQYPAATFAEEIGTDPVGFYLTVIVDVDDTEDVFEVIVDRLLDMQVEEALPIYVTFR